MLFYRLDCLIWMRGLCEEEIGEDGEGGSVLIGERLELM